MTCPHIGHLLNVNSLCALAHAAEAVFSTQHRPIQASHACALPRCMHTTTDANSQLPKTCTFPSTDMYCCVQCVHFSCAAHLGDHQHPLFISYEHARLYCAKCKDFVFNPYTDGVIELQRRIALSARRNFFHSFSPLDDLPHSEPDNALKRTRPKRRRLVVPTHWTPTKQEVNALSANALRFRNSDISASASPIGLYNLGNSCYMNSVLHAICHAPPLRYYFLADLHRPYCALGNSTECLACAFDGLVAASYRAGKITNRDRDRDASGGNAFVVPQTALEIIWKNAEHLATYAQHDAHEFLIAALNVLNTHCKLASPRDPRAKLPPTSPKDNLRAGKDGSFGLDYGERKAASVVKTMFSGTLQSDVVCSTCGNSSATLEKFYDVSLDVDKVRKPITVDVGGNEKDNVNSLFECLARFTEPEALGPGCKLHCNVCGKKEEAMKQMSIRSMPAIVSFHFKRFEQAFIKIRRSEMVKVDTPVEFPVNGLDLSPFQTCNVHRRRWLQKNGMPHKKCEPVQCEQLRPRKDSLYDLFAVVNHTGTIDSGHYTTLVRRDGEWFKCDDDKVVKMKPSMVGRTMRSKEAYLCFYAQREPNLTF